jgi:UDP-2-acetamido-2,6-beta-L-arabino-hexul-4-ose reductase
MNVLITGADGFIGKNLQIRLNELGNINIFKHTKNNDKKELINKINNSDFIFHLAGINRPKSNDEFFEGNSNLTEFICSEIIKSNKNTPILFSSSIQAGLSNPYGESKLLAEKHLKNLNTETENRVFIYRLPNVFGKWCKPNYNSVVATFCYNIVNGIDIEINNSETELHLVHIDDVIDSFINTMMTLPENISVIEIDNIHKSTVGELAKKLKSFKESRTTGIIDKVGSGFDRLLYATYLSYLRPNLFKYNLIKHEDKRGVFVEMLKTKNSGQFSYFTAHPGVTRGGHYHHIKNEKFLVLKGNAKFKFKHIITGETFEVFTTGDNPEIVETVPGWSHDITNISNDEMIVMIWANEIFNIDKPDTITFNT